eukprot:TRINITY_DN2748_c0_g1_i2.p1 TRINITY_DN2748_c0_g1~~TRINITY_DN2748_c0_g1_i2.p1  ORF type:complete len:114 (-),score=16.48 TRINITY_DN2748_c0_g1_i2:940-1281(-)
MTELLSLLHSLISFTHLSLNQPCCPPSRSTTLTACTTTWPPSSRTKPQTHLSPSVFPHFSFPFSLLPTIVSQPHPFYSLSVSSFLLANGPPSTIITTIPVGHRSSGPHDLHHL